MTSKDNSKHFQNYNISFLQCTNSDSDESIRMKLAFDALSTVIDIGPDWVTEEECMQAKNSSLGLFVVDPFSGKAFEHLWGQKCRIVGPLCIISCLQLGETLPIRKHPVYSVSFRGIIVSCSNINVHLRKELEEKIGLMGGIFSKDLTKSVTHLVAGEVGSKKYHFSASNQLPIMLPSWVKECWDQGQFELIRATDPVYVRHKCPVFQGLSISISQIAAEERQKYKSLIENNGGQYTGSASENTTHIVLLRPEGDKYKFAQQRRIHCMKLDWIKDSINIGYCMDESFYTLDSSKIPSVKKSTPEAGKADKTFSIDCSIIKGPPVSNVNETIQNEKSMTFNDPTKKSLSLLDAFDVSTLPKLGQFLDGAKIYLTGFNKIRLEKLKKIINAGSGMRFNTYSYTVSHVICKEKNADLVQQLKESSMKPFVVSCEWILECFKQDEMVDESPFLLMDMFSISPDKNTPPPSLQANPDPATTYDDNYTTLGNKDLGEDFSEILKQYSNSNYQAKSDAQKPNDYIFDNATTLVKDLPSKDKTNQSQNKIKEPDISTAIEIPEEDSVGDKSNCSTRDLFDRNVFKIVGFTSEDADAYSEIIKQNGGIVNQSSDRSDADIAIVPFIWSNSDVGAKVLLTPAWLDKCNEQQIVLQPDESIFFVPLDIDVSIKPLQNAVISITQYSGIERDYVIDLCNALGAICQEFLVRRVKPGKPYLPNTHLIAISPNGEKYTFANKWNIPTVTMQWLLAAAKSMETPPTDKYLLNPADNSSSSNAELFERNLSSSSKEMEIFAPVAQHAVERQTLPDQNRAAMVVEENLSKTPMAIPRIAELKQVTGSNNVDSPADRFNRPFKPQFELSKAQNVTPVTNTNSRTISTPDLRNNLLKGLAVSFANIKGGTQNPPTTRNELESDTNVESKTVLSGVVVCVSKKLSAMQQELNKIVKSLGAKYLWTFDSSCTHFVFQGKAKDLSKEFREAKRLRKHVVSPHWVYACLNESTRVPEDKYPHSYKSRMTLSEVSTLKISSTQILSQSMEFSKENDLNAEETNSKMPNRDVGKQLDEILVAARTARGEKRRPRKSITSTPSGKPQRVAMTTPTSSPAYTRAYARANHDTQSVEPSQSLPIIWDDPMGRLEREKIAANDSSFAKDNEEEVAEVPVNEFGGDNLNSSSVPSDKVFLLSSLPEEERGHYINAILKLGGRVEKFKFYHHTGTHLILGQLFKNEKFMASVASGKWVLHKSYLDRSLAENRFLPEEEFEWGSKATGTFFNCQQESQRSVAMCPKRWRLRIQENGHLPYELWKVTVVTHERKAESYKRILCAGGAKIVPMPCYDEDLTFAVVERGGQREMEIQKLLSKGVKCVTPEYVANYLTEDPPPSTVAFEITDVISSNGAKRRANESEGDGFKKSRLD